MIVVVMLLIALNPIYDTWSAKQLTSARLVGFAANILFVLLPAGKLVETERRGGAKSHVKLTSPI